MAFGEFQNAAGEGTWAMKESQPETPSEQDGETDPGIEYVSRVLEGLDFRNIALHGLRSAPLIRVLDTVVQAFDVEGELRPSEQLPTAFFLVHQWFATSTDLLLAALQLYRSSRSRCGECESAWRAASSTPRGPCGRGAACASLLYRRGLCGALRHWILLFPLHFEGDEAAKALVGELAASVVRDGLGPALLPFLDLSSVGQSAEQRCSFAWLRAVSKRGPVVRQVSLSFEQWRPEEIASALTHIEQRMLRRINFCEYREYAASTNLRDTPTLQKSIANFNSLSSWVQCMVLSRREPKERAEIMAKFIKVGHRLVALQNYNSLMAVLGGLTHSSLARLSKTHAQLGPDVRRQLNDFAELLSHAGNFSHYRRALDAAPGFKIPIIGVHLKDLISLDSALPDFPLDDAAEAAAADDDDVRTARPILLKKLASLAAIFSHLILDLHRPHNLPQPQVDLINTLKVSLDMRYNEEQIYEMSLAREPRGFLSSLSPAPKTLVFADWAAGVTATPDPITFHGHVEAMVTAVFKHYDHDRDGYISRNEFGSIVGNFPVLDPFPILDADRDGYISREEMRDYFVRVNAQATAAFRRSFRHHFHETTFLAPTICSHCSRLLWGIIRQGFKCKDCGLPVHRSCKDEVVAECRQKKATFLFPSEESPTPPGLASQVSSHAAAAPPPTIASAKRRLLLSLNRTKPERERIVSSTAAATSASPTPEPTPLLVTPTAPAFLPRLPTASRRRLNNRTLSEGGANVFTFRCQSPEYCEVLPSLASEEVFEDESPSYEAPSALT